MTKLRFVLNRHSLLWIYTLTLCLISVTSQAYDIDCLNDVPPWPPQDPECGVGENPIHPGSANVHREVTDLKTFGNAPIEFTRIYNSRTVNFNDAYWELGHRQVWQHNWNWEARDLAAQTNGFKQVKVRYPNGEEYNYAVINTNNPFQSVPAAAYIGDRVYMWTGGLAGCTLIKPNGWQYDFKRTISPKYRLEQVRNGQGFKWGFVYDGAHRLLRITNDFGRWIAIERQTNGNTVRISKIKTSDGREVSYHYAQWPLGGDYLITNVVYPDGSQAKYSYVSAQGNNGALTQRPLLSTAEDPMYPGNGARIKYVYNTNFIFDFGQGPYLVTGAIQEERNLNTDQLILSLPLGGGKYPQILEGNGAEITRKYGFGLIHEIRDAEGRTTLIQRSANGQGYVSALFKPNGGALYFGRDYAGRILFETNAMGGVSSRTYNKDGFLLSQSNELGQITIWQRDVGNRAIKKNWPDGSYEQWTYNNYGQVLTHRQRNSGIETFTYYLPGENGGLPGDLKTRTDAMGHTTTYTHDAAGNLTSVTDALSHITTYTYNWRGLVLTQTHPDNTTLSYSYDDFGNQLATTNELAQVNTYTYDEYNRVHTATDPLGRTTAYEYGLQPGCGSCANKNNLTQITYPSGRITQYTYDKSGRRITEEQAVGTPDEAITLYKYDGAGRLTNTTDANGAHWSCKYDLLDHKTQQTDPLDRKTFYTYDAVGNRLTVKRPDNTLTSFTYDSMNRVMTITDALGQTTEMGYDDTDQIGKLIDAKGNVHLHTYDLNGQLISLQYPDGSEETYQYDPCGNLLTYTTRAGQTLNCTYDNRDRQTQCDWKDPVTPNTLKDYDSVGRLLLLSNANSLITYTYNTAGELIAENQTITSSSGGTKTITYSANEDGLRQAMQYPDNGQKISYDYTARNQLQQISLNGDPLVTYQYDPTGRRITKQLANHTDTDYSYDMAGQLGKLVAKNSGGLFSALEYQYDQVGNRTSVQRDNGTTEQYGYDDTDQLTTVDTFQSPIGLPNKVTHYDYDKVGNREQVTENAITTPYHPNILNQYDSVNANPLNYDLNGNLVAQNGWSYIYDAQNRLIQASNSTTLASFNYDARNRCISRTINGNTTYLYYDDWNLIEERDPSDNLTTVYFHGAQIDELLLKITLTNTVYYHHDAIGNVNHLTDKNGHVLEKYVYDAFGSATILNSVNQVLQASAYANRFLFTGREYLKEVGLYDYRNRVYSLLLGRFYQIDPVRFLAGDLNLYQYVKNSPVNWVDPDGNVPLVIAVAAALAQHYARRAVATAIVRGVSPYVISRTISTLNSHGSGQGPGQKPGAGDVMRSLLEKQIKENANDTDDSNPNPEPPPPEPEPKEAKDTDDDGEPDYKDPDDDGDGIPDDWDLEPKIPDCITK